MGFKTAYPVNAALPFVKQNHFTSQQTDKKFCSCPNYLHNRPFTYQFICFFCKSPGNYLASLVGQQS